MSVVIILSMYLNLETIKCSPMFCEWLLYCSCVVTVIPLYVAQCSVSDYYIVHVSSLSYINMYPNVI